jgi:hypothetical protein
MQLRFERESSAEVRFEVPYAEPPSCGHFPRVALSLSRRLRWRSVLCNNSGAKSEPNANSRSGSEPNANANSNSRPESHSNANTGAVRSIGDTVMVGQYV